VEIVVFKVFFNLRSLNFVLQN